MLRSLILERSPGHTSANRTQHGPCDSLESNLIVELRLGKKKHPVAHGLERGPTHFVLYLLLVTSVMLLGSVFDDTLCLAPEQVAVAVRIAERARHVLA